MTAWSRFRQHRAGLAGAVVVALFAVLALAAWGGWVGSGATELGDTQWAPASADHWLGTNRLGQDIAARALAGTALAFGLGTVVALASTALGAAIGAIAGWRAGRPTDLAATWLMGVLDAIPFYLFAAALAFALSGQAWAMVLAMVATFWTPTARLVRAEVLRLRALDHVAAARALGLGELLILGRHVLPNTAHILLVQATLAFVAAIKTEVILSFLGIGVQDGVSWGLMLAEATQDVLAGHFGNFIAASSLLFALLLGFNLLSDGLQDVLGVREEAA